MHCKIEQDGGKAADEDSRANSQKFRLDCKICRHSCAHIAGCKAGLPSSKIMHSRNAAHLLNDAVGHIAGAGRVAGRRNLLDVSLEAAVPRRNL